MRDISFADNVLTLLYDATADMTVTMRIGMFRLVGTEITNEAQSWDVPVVLPKYVFVVQPAYSTGYLQVETESGPIWATQVLSTVRTCGGVVTGAFTRTDIALSNLDASVVQLYLDSGTTFILNISIVDASEGTEEAVVAANALGDGSEESTLLIPWAYTMPSPLPSFNPSPSASRSATPVSSHLRRA